MRYIIDDQLDAGVVLAVDETVGVVTLAWQVDVGHLAVDVVAALHLAVDVCATSSLHLW